ncbi:MAG: hypothetical protein CM15mP103_06200 [Gammaproteobacteria bacterium]|nr:MAG: hypothetical protein CM15mP103_06200 [Gammaproteobacteria bacterium]
MRGWAVATVGVDRVEIWIDGAYAFDAPYGGERGDVGGVFPDINDSVNSGFSTAWNYNLMDLGEHTITARAYNTNGQYAESSKTFLVTRFPNLTWVQMIRSICLVLSARSLTARFHW